MKRSPFLFALLLAFALCAALFPAAAHAEPLIYNGAVANTDNAAIRKNPSANSEVLVRVPAGEEMALLGTYYNTEWHKVCYKNKTGYIRRTQIDLMGVLPGCEYVGTVINCTDSTNVRASANAKGRLLGKAAAGTYYTVRVARAVNGWYEIDYGGQTGYIRAGYLRVRGVSQAQGPITSLSVTGGVLSPAFKPENTSYLVRCDSDTVVLSITAEDGVALTVNGEPFTGTYTVDMPAHSVKTVRLRTEDADGADLVSLYLIRGVLTVGTYNIKRCNNNPLAMGQLIADEQPDILGLQEVYTFPQQGHTRAVNNAAALRTTHMSESKFSKTVSYDTGGKYGIAMLSAYPFASFERTNYLKTWGEVRCYQRAVFSIDGKEVAVYNTHLTVGSSDSAKNARASQIRQLANAVGAETCPYIIVLGDFNTKADTLGPLTARLTVLNTSDRLFYSAAGKKLRGGRIDNILVSANITVYGVRLIDSDLSDHRPLLAYITLD